MPTLAACAHRFSVGMPFVYPDNSLDFAANFLSMMWKVAEPTSEPTRCWPRRSTCCSSCTPTTSRTAAPPRCAWSAAPTPTRTRPPRPPPPRSTARATAAPTSRSSACSPRSARSTTSTPSSRASRRARAASRASATGSTRTSTRGRTIIKQTADEVFEVTGKNPLLDIALKLEEVALADDYFISRKLYPNVDFYSGLIYQAMGFPIDMFTVLFAIPRTSGWLAHWKELLEQDQRIARPRQLYIGAGERAYVPMANR